MLANPNPKVVGAFVIGFALVAGAYTISNFGKPTMTQSATAIVADAPARVTIAVTDNDDNGIEDWRDEFVSSESIVLNQATTTYIPPTTLTGQLGINLIEGIVRSRSAGPFGLNDEEVIGQTVDALARENILYLYDVKDISVMKNWNENDIRNYANAMAGAIIRNEVPGIQGEVEILSDIVSKHKTERMNDLKILADVYKRTRDDSLNVPVPLLFVKQHLDLINTYSALYGDINSMTMTLEDPLVAMMGIKRYQDDALGLKLAMENMYVSFEPYSGLFSNNDAATLFSAVSPNKQNP
jgi:hypothetical protein